jgi:hypothetical protein
MSVPALAQVYDSTKLVGSYKSDQSKDFVFVKRLAISKSDNGKVKFAATLSGFPDDVYLGEAEGEAYTSRNAEVYRNYLVNFTSGKISVFMIVNTSGNSYKGVTVNSYMKWVDGSRPNVFFDGVLQRDADTK